MDNVRTFFAIIKAYMIINILITPKGFANGGFFFSPFMTILACGIEMFSTLRLVNIANERKIYSF